MLRLLKPTVISTYSDVILPGGIPSTSVSAAGLHNALMRSQFSAAFLAPCPSSGLIIHGDKDAVVPAKDVTTLVDKLKTQKGIIIEQKIVPGANHFFDGKVEALLTSITGYLDKRLKTERKPAA